MSAARPLEWARSECGKQDSAHTAKLTLGFQAFPSSSVMWNFLSHCWRNARTIILRVTGDSERLSPLRLGRFRSCSTSSRQDRMESVLLFFPTYDFPSSLVSVPPALLGLSIPLIFPGRCNSPPFWPIRFPDSLVSVFSKRPGWQINRAS